ncbi:hypothetical protein Acsp06_50970 [Actinomycetospora sp. NBRC 106375]|nr:hypothetical protein Acsp06_50970 [Actinomycetospora sp. NBRC 106375]
MGEGVGQLSPKPSIRSNPTWKAHAQAVTPAHVERFGSGAAIVIATTASSNETASSRGRSTPVVPPHVEYELTEPGKTLEEPIRTLERWDVQNPEALLAGGARRRERTSTTQTATATEIGRGTTSAVPGSGPLSRGRGRTSS